MEQQGLPGFPANAARAAKLRQRRQIKGVQAVLSLARCLEKLLDADPPGSDLVPGELAARLRRKRGRPKVERTAAAGDHAGEIRPGSLRLIPLPVPNPKPNYDAMVAAFASDCFEPAAPGEFTWAREVYWTFQGWFKRKYPAAEEVPSQRMIGILFKHLYAKEKNGCYRYKCKIKEASDVRTDFSHRPI